MRLQRFPNAILELTVNILYLFIPDLKILTCLSVTMVLYVDYFTQGILNYKSYYVAGWEARNHVANKQINLQGYLTRKNPHRPHAQPALVEITYFVRRLYRWKVPGGE